MEPVTDPFGCKTISMLKFECDVNINKPIKV